MTLLLSITMALAAAATPAAEGPTEASLLAAWEASLRADSGTVRLEPIGERRFRFETTRLPFSGELAVTNLVVDDGAEYGGEGLLIGVVEVELVGADAQELARRHPYSYSRWQAGQMMYWSGDASRWLTAREWRAPAPAEAPSCSPWFGLVSRNLFWLLLAVILVAMLAPLVRRANRQMASATSLQERVLADQARSMALIERSLAIAEDSNRTLHEMLDELRREPPGGDASRP